MSSLSPRERPTTSTAVSGIKEAIMAYNYDKDIDYQALINQAAASGDMKAAGMYEQQRNAKISDLDAAGTNTYGATATDNYSHYLQSASGIGVHTQEQAAIRDQMNQNSMQWWAADDATKAQLEAANQKLAAQLGSGVTYDATTGTWSGTADEYEMLRPSFNYNDYLEQNQKPTYESQYSDRIDALLDQILNRDKFSYDPETDQLYQSYKKQYNREGTRAMNDTLAAMASGAGGMNSWAATAAQQANDYYSTKLTDKIPELYQLAYDMYLNDIDLQMQDMGLLQQMDETQYGRYRDTMDDWYKDRDFAYGQYRDDMGDYQYDSGMKYQEGRDKIEDERYKNEWDNNISREQLEDERYKSEMAYGMAMDFLSNGVMPDDATLTAAGISPAMAAAMIARLFPEAAASAGGSGSGGPRYSGGDGPRYTGGDPTIDWDSVSGLGFGMQSEDWLSEMEARGVITSTEVDGKYVFSLTDYGELVRREAQNGDVPIKGNSTSSTTNKTTSTPTPKPTPAPAPAPQPTPTPTPAPNTNISTVTDVTGTAGIGSAAATAVEWIKNQILKKNK